MPGGCHRRKTNPLTRAAYLNNRGRLGAPFATKAACALLLLDLGLEGRGEGSRFATIRPAGPPEGRAAPAAAAAPAVAAEGPAAPTVADQEAFQRFRFAAVGRAVLPRELALQAVPLSQAAVAQTQQALQRHWLKQQGLQALQRHWLRLHLPGHNNYWTPHACRTPRPMLETKVAPDSTSDHRAVAHKTSRSPHEYRASRPLHGGTSWALPPGRCHPSLAPRVLAPIAKREDRAILSRDELGEGRT